MNNLDRWWKSMWNGSQCRNESESGNSNKCINRNESESASRNRNESNINVMYNTQVTAMWCNNILQSQPLSISRRIRQYVHMLFSHIILDKTIDIIIRRKLGTVVNRYKSESIQAIHCTEDVRFINLDLLSEDSYYAIRVLYRGARLMCNAITNGRFLSSELIRSTDQLFFSEVCS